MCARCVRRFWRSKLPCSRCSTAVCELPEVLDLGRRGRTNAACSTNVKLCDVTAGTCGQAAAHQAAPPSQDALSQRLCQPRPQVFCRRPPQADAALLLDRAAARVGVPRLAGAAAGRKIHSARQLFNHQLPARAVAARVRCALLHLRMPLWSVEVLQARTMTCSGRTCPARPPWLRLECTAS